MLRRTALLSIVSFAMLPAAQLPERMRLVHEGSGEEAVLPLQWPADGRSAISTWPVPAGARGATLFAMDPSSGRLTLLEAWANSL